MLTRLYFISLEVQPQLLAGLFFLQFEEINKIKKDNVTIERIDFFITESFIGIKLKFYRIGGL